MPNPIDELRATYKRMPEAQLLDLAAEIDQLTDDARTALRDELDRRGIADEAGQDSDAAPPESSAATRSGLPEWFLGSKSPPLPDSEFVAVFSAATESEAAEVQESLRAAGIESQVEYVILVPQAQSEKAVQVLPEQLGPDSDSNGDEDADSEDQNN